MNYYEVLVTSSKYHGDSTLTYSYENELFIGQVVLVPMRSYSSSAIVIRKVAKPKFKTKDINSILVDKPLPQISLKLLKWIQEYYPSPISSVANQFIPNELLRKNSKYFEDSYSKSPKVNLPPLTKEQQKVTIEIKDGDKSAYMIHGVTGSGKTRVYIELAKNVLASNKSVMILTPEISLTPQLESNLKESLEAEVLVIHSNLTPKERRNLWFRILDASRPQVIIGPRSALFSPVTDLGLIVIDEFHDNAYKQDQNPRYHALRVAGYLAKLHNAKLVYGSATPPVSEYHIALQRDVPILKMNNLATGTAENAKIEIINTRDRTKFGRSPYFSDSLLSAIEHAILNKEQSLVFLNRRGTARLVFCQNCDWQALCPGCDLPLTYHGDSHNMRCHTCGFSQQPPTSCPLCKSPDIIYKSFGTKAIVFQLQKLFPQAKIQRFDTDNLKSERFDQNFYDVISGNVDILVGTQLLVKGLDLPKLSVVGVVAADSSLYFPDYTADEQTYQMLTQVIGRISRGHRDGTAIIQTHNPNGKSLIAAVNKDWDMFYKQQIIERSKFIFPPFCYLLKLTCSRKSQKSAISAAEKLALQIQKLHIKAQVVGPAPRFIEKNRGEYNWQLIIKSKQRKDLLQVIAALPANWSYDIDPSNLL